jgi:hypothetical protein
MFTIRNHYKTIVIKAADFTNPWHYKTIALKAPILTIPNHQITIAFKAPDLFTTMEIRTWFCETKRF